MTQLNNTINNVLSYSDSEISVEESPITNSQGRSGNKNVYNGTKQKCHGFRPNFEEIKNLISNFRPYILALQETHFKDTDNVNIRGFDHYF